MNARRCPSARLRRLVPPLLAAALLAGCARETRPMTARDAAAVRAACPPGSFVAAMASNCPTPAP